MQINHYHIRAEYHNKILMNFYYLASTIGMKGFESLCQFKLTTVNCLQKGMFVKNYPYGFLPRSPNNWQIGSDSGQSWLNWAIVFPDVPWHVTLTIDNKREGKVWTTEAEEELEVTEDAIRIRCTCLSGEAERKDVKIKIEDRDYEAYLSTTFRSNL